MDFIVIAVTIAAFAVMGWVFYKAFRSSSENKTNLPSGTSGQKHHGTPSQVPAE